MSSTNPLPTTRDMPADILALERWFDARFDARFNTAIADWQENRPGSLSLIVTKGTLDWAYPPFILASTASALGWKVSMFFTFYGLALLKKNLDLQISPLGNPGMPMKMPFGPKWFQTMDWNIPNAVMAGVPGFEKLATGLMKKTIGNNGVASIAELREACIEGEVNMLACQMTVDLFGWSRDEFIPQVTDFVGAASFLPTANQSTVTLFM